MICFWVVVLCLCMKVIESPGCLQYSCPRWHQRSSLTALGDHPDGDSADECHSSVEVLPSCALGVVEIDNTQISKAS